ncbi:MAG: SUMF1/EgtB/PvdO family nonheme iron enzyme [Treponema sp.]|jgi:formylglycine-generating enzyme required for sulfatase activity/uncharacterized caspase-like protein|nr:SUMF1/EgtB/PvdO family nonheme iron enzyme [Treponema sp.]
MKSKILYGALGVLAVVLIVLFSGWFRKRVPPEQAPAADLPITVLPATGLPSGEITVLAFSRDGKYFLSGSSEGYLRVWELLAGKQTGVLEAGGSPLTGAFNPGGTMAATGDGEGAVRVWDLASGGIVQEFKADSLASLDYSADGTILTLADGGGLRYWDALSGKALEEGARGMESSGRAVLGGGGERVLSAGETGARLFSTADGRELGSFSALGGAELLLAQSFDGGRVAGAGGEGPVTIVDAGGGENADVAAGFPGISALALDAGGGRLLTGHKDGVVRLWDTETGAELARYLGTGGADGEWAGMTASGYYNASAHGASLFSITDGEERYTLSQFAEALHRPDLFYKILSGREPAPEDTLETWLGNSSLQPPLVEILTAAGTEVPGETAELRAKITVRRGGLGAITVYNRETLEDIYTIDEIKTSEGKEKGNVYYEVTMNVPVEAGQNQIGVGAFNKNGMIESGIPEIGVVSAYTGPAGGDGKPALHILLAGIGTYQSPEIKDLDFTIADAEALGEVFRRQEGRSLFSKINIVSLYNEEVTKEGFYRAFDGLKKEARRDDTFVFFYSGHGAVDRGGDFFFFPYDSAGEDNPPGDNITKTDIIKNMLKIKARNVLIMLDTCRSGAILEMDSAFGRLWKKLERKAVLVAAAGNQYAIESSAYGHGLFTWSILDSLEGGAVSPGTRYVGVTEMMHQVRREVPEIAAAVTAGETALRGGSFLDEEIRQEPLAKLPAVNFTIIDLGEIWEGIPVKGGVFTMGSPDGEKERKREEIRRRVTVDDFIIGKYEVTQEEYAALMGSNPGRFKDGGNPVEQVSWFEAVEYCNRRSRREGLNPAYVITGQEVRWDKKANGYRLPTEAEWEYACRAGTTGPFSTGSAITTEMANFNGSFSYAGAPKGRARGETVRAGSFDPNPWGIHDMHGNVWEWCWDWKAPYPEGSVSNPAGPGSGSYKVSRGGSWRVGAQSLRSALRGSNPPGDRGDGLGFRLVRSF